MLQPDSASGRRGGRLRWRAAPLAEDSPEWRALDARIEASHIARLIQRALAQLDLEPLLLCYQATGSAAYPPLLLLGCVLFQTHQGFHSPAQWHRHGGESLPACWLLRGCVPSRTCWYNFRDRLDPALLALARQAVARAIGEGFTPADRAAVDGTSVEANSTRHHLLNQDRLDRRLEQLRAATAEQTTQPAGQASAEPSASPEPVEPSPEPVEPRSPGWMAKTARGRQEQLHRYEAAARQMSDRQQRNQQKRKSKRTAADKIVISPGDPQAAVGRDKLKVFRPLYNAQILADIDSPLILGYEVFAQVNDAGLLGGLLRQVKEGLGRTIEVVLADSAYAGGQDLADAEAQAATVYAPWQANDYSAKDEPAYYPKERFEWRPDQRCYVCPAGQPLTYRGKSRQQRSGAERIELRLYKAEESACQTCEQRGACTSAKTARSISRGEHEELIEALRARMAGDEAKALYRLRKQVVERINADIKQHRSMRRLSGRGLKRARIQLGLVVLAHNLVCLEKLRAKRTADADAATPSPTTG